jgi:WD repeat and SOF domain-containing protein 1
MTKFQSVDGGAYGPTARHSFIADGILTKPDEHFISNRLVNCLDLSLNQRNFVTGGDGVELWDIKKSLPIERFSWGSDTITRVKFNPVEQHLILATSLDRGLFLHDTRSQSNLAKVNLMNKSSAICWNPQEPFNFVAGNEDGNVYTFDMRKMDTAKKIHKDHIGAILDIDFAPTGKEFVTGSFDQTIRIFGYNAGRSRQVYHLKRMQKVFSVLWTTDNKYLLSGSEDANIRLWKANPSEKLGVVSEREKSKQEYRETLQQKFKYNDQIKRIGRIHVPKYIVTARNRKFDKNEARIRKDQNRKLNNEALFEEPAPEVQRRIAKTE